MKVVQGFAAALLCLLLLVCLGVFSVGLFVKTTVLNEDFITGQVGNLELVDIARDYVEEEDLLELPAEIEFARPYIYEVVEEYEPWLKTEISNAINKAYAYLKGERKTLYIVVSMTQVKSTLKSKLWERVQDNLAGAVPEILNGVLARYIEGYIEQYIRLVPEELLPKGTLDLPSRQLVDFLKGYLSRTNLTIMMVAVPEMRGLLEDAIEPYFDQYVDEFIDDIPDNLILDEEEIEPEIMNALKDARRYIGYFQTGFYGLLGIIILLVIGVILVYRDVVNTSLSLGITLTLFGLVTTGATLFGRTINYSTYFPDDIPARIQDWMTSAFHEALMPVLIFGGGMLAPGIILIVIAVIFRQRAVAD